MVSEAKDCIPTSPMVASPPRNHALQNSPFRGNRSPSLPPLPRVALPLGSLRDHFLFESRHFPVPFPPKGDRQPASMALSLVTGMNNLWLTLLPISWVLIRRVYIDHSSAQVKAFSCRYKREMRARKAVGGGVGRGGMMGLHVSGRELSIA